MASNFSNVNTFSANACGDDNIFMQSMVNWIKSRNEEMSQRINAICDGINDDNTPISEIVSRNGLQPGSIIIISGKAMQVEQAITGIRNAIQSDSVDVIIDMPDGTSFPLNLDEMVTDMNQSLKSSIVVESAITSCLDSQTSAGVTPVVFSQNLQLRLNEVDASAALLSQQCYEVLSNIQLSARDKMHYIFESAGLFTMTAAPTPSQIDLKFPGPFTDVSGSSPLAAWVSGLSISLDGVEDAILASVYLSGKFIENTVNAIWDAATGVASWMINTFKTNVTDAIDVYENEYYNDQTLHSYGYYAKFDIFMSGAPSDDFRTLWEKLSHDEYMIVSLPGANVYLWRSSPEITPDEHHINIAIKWVPINPSGYDSLINDIRATGESRSIYLDEMALYLSRSKALQRLEGKVSDDDMYKALQYAKAMFTVLSRMATTVVTQVPTTNTQFSNTTYNSIELTIPRSNMNVMYNKSPMTNPTNLDFYREMSGDQYGLTPSDGYYTIDTFDIGNSSVLTMGISNALTRWILYISRALTYYEEGEAFLPYVRSQVQFVGRYAVKTDSENAETYSSFLKTLAITTTVVASAVLTFVVFRALTRTSLVALTASQAQNRRIGDAVLDGTITRSDIDQARRLNLKSRILNGTNAGIAGSALGVTGLISDDKESFSYIAGLIKPL